jgi:hypothetical protein
MKSGNPALFRNFGTAKGETNLVHRLLVDDLAVLKSGRGLDGRACLLIVDIWKKLFRWAARPTVFKLAIFEPRLHGLNAVLGAGITRAAKSGRG